MFRFRTQPKTKPQATLYVVVFGSLYVKLSVFLLLAFMLLQPVGSVLAAGEEAASESSSEPAEEVVESEPEPEPETIEEVKEEEVSQTTKEAKAESDEEEAVAQNEVSEDKEVTEEETTETAAADEESSSSPALDEEAVDGEETTTTVVDDDTQIERASSSEEMNNDVSEPVATSSTDSTAGGGGGNSTDTNNENEIKDTATSSPTSVEEEETASTTDEETTASSTDEMVSEDPVGEVLGEDLTNEVEEQIDEPEAKNNNEPESGVEMTQNSQTSNASNTPTSTVEYIYVVEEDVNDANRYQFSVDECVSVGDGSFYCNKSNGQTTTLEDAVYAEADADGDREIYLRLDGVVTKITDNTFDEASPQFDQVSGQIVWHRLISGRYQIIQYDIESGTEEQLTYSNQNNMEPTQNAGVTVWQTWVGDNWDIALYEDGETTIISDNNQHDVAPEIRNGYVIWHTTDNEGQKLLSVYELATGVTSSIADPDGGHVENPRFVLVYDTEYENGDKVTKQYDPETGEILPVSSQPATPLPDLPDPEPAGETTALLTNKNPNSKEDGDGLIDLPSGDSSNNTKASTSALTTIDNTASSTEEVSGTEDVVVASSSPVIAEEPLPLTEFDLIVEPFSTTSSAQENDTGSSTNNVE